MRCHTGIAIAFRSRAFERVVEPIGMIDELRRGFAFDAENPAVRMIGRQQQAESLSPVLTVAMVAQCAVHRAQ